MSQPLARHLRGWLTPERPADVAVITDRTERRAVWIEIVIVLLLTFGMSALSSTLSLIEAELETPGIGSQSIALNTSTSSVEIIDILRQALGVVRLCTIAALALYLIWRASDGGRAFPLRRVGIRRLTGADVGLGVGLAALIGLPGLGLYWIGRQLGFTAQIVPSTLTDTWWRLPMLIAEAIGNAGAEEILVVAWVITRLRQLGYQENTSLVAAAVLRGGYHLYQGVGGGIGNVVMGLIYGRVYQKTGRLWPLFIGHALIDTVAYVGYVLWGSHWGWLR